tara:strand:- start:756 stop:1085 length:330 start_codon:yes stop_codon:yes gene_type:complete
MSNETVLNLTLEQANKAIERNAALVRLYQNKDFQNAVLEGYFKDEAVRLVLAKGNPSMDAPEQQAAIVRDIDGIGSLASYFTAIRHEAAMSEKALKDADEDRQYVDDAE